MSNGSGVGGVDAARPTVSSGGGSSTGSDPDQVTIHALLSEIFGYLSQIPQLATFPDQAKFIEYLGSVYLGGLANTLTTQDAIPWFTILYLMLRDIQIMPAPVWFSYHRWLGQTIGNSLSTAPSHVIETMQTLLTFLQTVYTTAHSR